jgi:hypothetical protein
MPGITGRGGGGGGGGGCSTPGMTCVAAHGGDTERGWQNAAATHVVATQAIMSETGQILRPKSML